MSKAPHDADQIRNASSMDKATEMIRENLRASNMWLIRGLLAIYQRQTDDEQQSEFTKHNNGVGFGAFDSQIMTSYAKQAQEKLTKYANSKRKWDWALSEKQLAVCRKNMLKYAGQLARIAREQVKAE